MYYFLIPYTYGKSGGNAKIRGGNLLKAEGYGGEGRQGSIIDFERMFDRLAAEQKARLYA